MFVGAAVAGVVISTAKGVKARGALVRDISCYLVAVAAVAIILRGGRFTWVLAVMLLVMYLLFVAAVLAADIIHIWQSKTRWACSLASTDSPWNPSCPDLEWLKLTFTLQSQLGSNIDTCCEQKVWLRSITDTNWPCAVLYIWTILRLGLTIKPTPLLLQTSEGDAYRLQIPH